MGYSELERYLLSAPVPKLGLQALLSPTECELVEREAELGWHRDSGVGELLFTLRINGVLILFAPEFHELGRKSL